MIRALKQKIYLNDINRNVITDMICIATLLENDAMQLFKIDKSYNNIVSILKNNKSYKMLPAQTSQIIINNVVNGINNKSKIVWNKQYVKYDGDNLRLSVGRLYKKETGRVINIPFKSPIDNIDIIKVYIYYRNNQFYMSILYNVDKHVHATIKDKTAYVYFGIDNIATIIVENDVYTINGRPLKSFNRYFNLISCKYGTNKHNRQMIKRENYINNYFNQVTNWIIKHCISCKVDKVVMDINFKYKNNFINLPINTLVNKIVQKAHLNNIDILLDKFTICDNNLNHFKINVCS